LTSHRIDGTAKKSVTGKARATSAIPWRRRWGRGVNYFDVATGYGNAQERLGPALAPYRKNCFLACKTEGRTKDASRKQLEESLRLLNLWRRRGLETNSQ
jgi:aryl-alcohol dehydrogenase-like predicted oxidoreductase